MIVAKKPRNCRWSASEPKSQEVTFFTGVNVQWAKSCMECKSCRSLHAYALPKGISKMWECCLGALLHIARLEKDDSSLFSLYWRRSWWPLLSWRSAMHRCSGKGRNLTVFLTRLRGRKPFAFGRVVTISCHSHSLDPCFFPKTNSQEPKGAWRKPSGQAISELARAWNMRADCAKEVL